jgi:hypothetical protein
LFMEDRVLGGISRYHGLRAGRSRRALIERDEESDS